MIKKEGDIALKALSKELDIEKMLEKEELLKEEQEDEILDYQVNLEKKKEDCILKAIKEREKENQFNLRQENKSEELNNLHSIAKKQILIRRDYLRKKLENLRNRANKKHEIKNRQIMSIRMEVANELAKSYKKGMISNCLKAVKSNEDWEAYCKISFQTSVNEMSSCFKEEQNKKCETCCEIEFGDLYIIDRKKCTDMVCVVPLTNDNPGRWIWKKDESN